MMACKNGGGRGTEGSFRKEAGNVIATGTLALFNALSTTGTFRYPSIAEFCPSVNSKN